MEKFYEQMEDYLHGTLTGKELAEFEKAILSDADLAKSVAQHREMTQRLAALQLRNKVKSALNNAPAKAKKVSFFASRTIWTMAATLTLLAAAIWFFNQPSRPAQQIAVEKPTETPPAPAPAENAPIAEQTTPVPDKNIPAPKNEKPNRQLALAREFQIRPSSDMVRDAAQITEPGTVATPAQQAAEAFEKQNYRRVNELLSSEETVAGDPTARSLRAAARFELGQYMAAANDYDALKNSFQYKYEARWNYLQCQLASGKDAEVKKLLDAMVQDPSYPYHKKALELRNKLSAK